MHAVRDHAATKSDIAASKSDIAALCHDLKSDLKSETAKLKSDLTLRGLGALIASLSILFGALHLFPP